MDGILTRNLPGKRPISADPHQIEGQCKRCKLAIYRGEKREWVRDPEAGILGLCHSNPEDCFKIPKFDEAAA